MKPNRKKRQAKAPKRRRFERARDTLDQLQQIESAQNRSRQQGKPDKIFSIEKSRQRFKNSLANIRSPKDADEQFR